MKRSAILSLMFIAGLLAVPGALNAQVEKRVLWNINIFGELMVVSNDKTEAFTIGIRSH